MTLNVMPCFLKQKRRSLPPLCSSAFIRYCYSSSLCCSSSSNIFLWRFFMSCVYHMSMSIAASMISRWRIQQLKSSKLLASGVFSASISVSAYPSVMTIPGFPFPFFFCQPFLRKHGMQNRNVRRHIPGCCLE